MPAEALCSELGFVSTALASERGGEGSNSFGEEDDVGQVIEEVVDLPYPLFIL